MPSDRLRRAYLQAKQEQHRNANKSVSYWGEPGCMAADQKELLWAVSATIEAQAQALMGKGEAANLTDLRNRFAQAPYHIC